MPLLGVGVQYTGKGIQGSTGTFESYLVSQGRLRRELVAEASFIYWCVVTWEGVHSCLKGY
jgi:hypothetical protein